VNPLVPSLDVDVVADFSCPWSFLGWRRLGRVLGHVQTLAAPNLRWHGFRLPRPDAEHSGSAWRAHLGSRLTPGLSAEFVERSLAEAGSALGIRFDFEGLVAVPDTTDAHRLAKLAEREGRLADVVDAVFRAYFEAGQDIGDPAVLAALGHDAGLSADALAAFGEQASARAEIEAEEQRLRLLGVQAVPNLLLNGRVHVPGPADEVTYLRALDHALFPTLAAPEGSGGPTLH
jgi:predicted DsbA family dithiol-disulfide isomerase